MDQAVCGATGHQRVCPHHAGTHSISHNRHRLHFAASNSNVTVFIEAGKTAFVAVHSDKTACLDQHVVVCHQDFVTGFDSVFFGVIGMDFDALFGPALSDVITA